MPKTSVTLALLLIATSLTTTASAAARFCDGIRATKVGTNGDDTLVGTARRDVIVGLGGNDILRGRDGRDLLCGGPGRDTLYGELDNDSLDGDRGNDLLIGGRAGDSATGDEGADELRMGTGPDSINAGEDPGRDLFDAGPGSDLLVMSVPNDSEGEPDAATGPAFVDLATGEVRGTDGGEDVIVGGTVENIYGTGRGDELYGDDRPNVLVAGYTGEGFLYGRGGDDKFHTGIEGGATTFDGGPGDDVFYPTQDENSADGGEGSDTIDYCMSGGDVTVDLAAGEGSNAEGTTTFTSIENAVSCGGDDSLFGNDEDNKLDAGDGSDSIDGRGGNDTCTGGEEVANCES